jgi:hypothetical protein
MIIHSQAFDTRLAEASNRIKAKLLKKVRSGARGRDGMFSQANKPKAIDAYLRDAGVARADRELLGLDLKKRGIQFKRATGAKDFVLMLRVIKKEETYLHQHSGAPKEDGSAGWRWTGVAPYSGKGTRFVERRGRNRHERLLAPGEFGIFDRGMPHGPPGTAPGETRLLALFTPK